MRNGINVAAISEIANEIKLFPQEALYRYEVAVRWDGAPAFTGRVQPLLAGTTVSARPFQLRIAPTREVAEQARAMGEDARTPDELFIAGLGGCVLITTLMGLTTKAYAISRLALQIDAPMGKGEDIAYRLACCSAGNAQEVAAVVDMVQNYSPNHRTLVEANEVQLTVRTVRTHGDVLVMAQAPKSASPDTARNARLDRLVMDCEWERSVQLRSRVVTSSGTDLLIDVPKSMGGIDKAPNPQEYLLLGAASSVAREFHELATDAKLKLSGFEVSMSGLVDLQGIMRIDPEVPPKVQEMACSLTAFGEADESQCRALAQEALNRSHQMALLRQPMKIGIEGSYETLPLETQW